MRIGLLLGFIVLVFITFSCQRDTGNKELVDLTLSNFMPTLVSNSLADNNSLVFVSQGRWSDNYCLVISSKGEHINCFYYEMDPNNELYNSKDHENFDRFFFRGVSFELNSSAWSNLKSKFDTIFQKSHIRHDKIESLDGHIYIMSFGEDFIINNKDNLSELKEFSVYLKKMIIDPIIVSRLDTLN